MLANAGRLDMWLHIALVALTVASVWRYLNGHGLGDDAPVILSGAGLLLATYLAFPMVSRSGSSMPARVWCLGLVAIWLMLVLVAPSFAWVAVTLVFVVLRVLPFGPASAVVAAMMGAVVVAWMRMRGEFDPTIVAGPVGIAGLAILAFRLMERDSAARQRLLDDLRDAQGELADAQHGAGVLAERARLSREIHDSVAQRLTSINLLLQAAEQDWAARPSASQGYVGQAALTARDGLDEVRRVVRDLAPAELSDGDDAALESAIRRAGEHVAHSSGLLVAVNIHGDPQPVSPDLSTALLRSVRGALANVVEHAAATHATVSLTYQPGSVSLDIRDNGIGFDPGAIAPASTRGRGLSGIRTRAQHFGGQLAVESAPGEGTAVGLLIPIEGQT